MAFKYKTNNIIYSLTNFYLLILKNTPEALNQAKEVFRKITSSNLLFNSKGVVAIFLLALQQVIMICFYLKNIAEILIKYVYNLE